MPNAKAGTVTTDVTGTIQNIKAGQIEYRVERSSGVVQVPIGKVSFEEESIKQNLNAVMSALVAARPSAVKGRYIRSVAISATMGSGIRIDPQQFA
jgi:large subunit ribosomal protein L1